jgi:hypothetical protein
MCDWGGDALAVLRRVVPRCAGGVERQDGGRRKGEFVIFLGPKIRRGFGQATLAAFCNNSVSIFYPVVGSGARTYVARASELCIRAQVVRLTL